MTIRKIIAAAAVVAMVASCSTPKNIAYFQDTNFNRDYEVTTSNEIVVKPTDKISIVVKSQDATLSSMFNLPVVSQRIGLSEQSSLANSQQMSCYTVDNAGCIDFPILGKINVAGMNRETIAKTIKDKLMSQGLVKDPVVTVEFANLYVSVFGEVRTPGRFPIERDKVTLLDALSKAGDLTIHGRRENVIVLRQQTDGTQKPYSVDLTSIEKLYSSPVFYLQQNDVIYVEPNESKKRESTTVGNNFFNPTFYLSLASVLTSVAVLIFRK
ncbi:MAG: polysaccharide biosynthesis/export family protein [Muribaculaceae bacterium]|nr:polysaccharide biosynthesis/export family protein [Muribaculaceae bacterium]